MRCIICGDTKFVRCPSCEGSGSLLLFHSAGFATSKCMECKEKGEIPCPTCRNNLYEGKGCVECGVTEPGSDCLPPLNHEKQREQFELKP